MATLLFYLTIIVYVNDLLAQPYFPRDISPPDGRFSPSRRSRRPPTIGYPMFEPSRRGRHGFERGSIDHTDRFDMPVRDGPSRYRDQMGPNFEAIRDNNRHHDRAWDTWESGHMSHPPQRKPSSRFETGQRQSRDGSWSRPADIQGQRDRMIQRRRDGPRRRDGQGFRSSRELMPLRDARGPIQPREQQHFLYDTPYPRDGQNRFDYFADQQRIDTSFDPSNLRVRGQRDRLNFIADRPPVDRISRLSRSRIRGGHDSIGGIQDHSSSDTTGRLSRESNIRGRGSIDDFQGQGHVSLDTRTRPSRTPTRGARDSMGNYPDKFDVDTLTRSSRLRGMHGGTREGRRREFLRDIPDQGSVDSNIGRSPPRNTGKLNSMSDIPQHHPVDSKERSSRIRDRDGRHRNHDSPEYLSVDSSVRSSRIGDVSRRNTLRDNQDNVPVDSIVPSSRFASKSGRNTIHDNPNYPPADSNIRSSSSADKSGRITLRDSPKYPESGKGRSSRIGNKSGRNILRDTSDHPRGDATVKSSQTETKGDSRRRFGTGNVRRTLITSTKNREMKQNSHASDPEGTVIHEEQGMAISEPSFTRKSPKSTEVINNSHSPDLTSPGHSTSINHQEQTSRHGSVLPQKALQTKGRQITADISVGEVNNVHKGGHVNNAKKGLGNEKKPVTKFKHGIKEIGASDVKIESVSGTMNTKIVDNTKHSSGKIHPKQKTGAASQSEITIGDLSNPSHRGQDHILSEILGIQTAIGGDQAGIPNYEIIVLDLNDTSLAGIAGSATMKRSHDIADALQNVINTDKAKTPVQSKQTTKATPSTTSRDSVSSHGGHANNQVASKRGAQELNAGELLGDGLSLGELPSLEGAAALLGGGIPVLQRGQSLLGNVNMQQLLFQNMLMENLF